MSSTPPHSQKMYYREKMKAKWECERIKQRRELASRPPVEPYSITTELCEYLSDSLDKEYCARLDPYIDVQYKKDKEVAIYLRLKDDTIAMGDIIRFIHAIIVGKYYPKTPFNHKPLSVILLREIDKLRAYQRIFEVIHPPYEWGEARKGFSILRTEGFSEAGVMEILAQPLSANAKGLNADNFVLQLSILGNGKPCSLRIAPDVISGRIFARSSEKIEISRSDDTIEKISFFAGVSILTFFMLW